jgi:hypothetical protein
MKIKINVTTHNQSYGTSTTRVLIRSKKWDLDGNVAAMIDGKLLTMQSNNSFNGIDIPNEYVIYTNK